MELAYPEGSLPMSSRTFRKEALVVESRVPMRETTGKALSRLKQLVSRLIAFHVYPPLSHRTSSWSYTNTHGPITLANFRSS